MPRDSYSIDMPLTEFYSVCYINKIAVVCRPHRHQQTQICYLKGRHENLIYNFKSTNKLLLHTVIYSSVMHVKKRPPPPLHIKCSLYYNYPILFVR